MEQKRTIIPCRFSDRNYVFAGVLIETAMNVTFPTLTKNLVFPPVPCSG